MNYLMLLKDGYIKDIRYEKESYPGCPTCDYGSSYIFDIYIYLKNYTLSIHSNKMYYYVFSEGDLMKLLLNNCEYIKSLTEKEFCDYVKEWVERNYKKNDECYKWQGTKIKVEVKSYE